VPPVYVSVCLSSCLSVCLAGRLVLDSPAVFSPLRPHEGFKTEACAALWFEDTGCEFRDGWPSV